MRHIKYYERNYILLPYIRHCHQSPQRKQGTRLHCCPQSYISHMLRSRLHCKLIHHHLQNTTEYHSDQRIIYLPTVHVQSHICKYEERSVQFNTLWSAVGAAKHWVSSRFSNAMLLQFLRLLLLSLQEQHC